MQVCIVCVDSFTPAPVVIRYPSILDQPRAELRAYPPETVVAEKFQAMVALDMINTRLKDFYDLWAIANAFEFAGTVLARAIAAAFERRQTKVPAQSAAALPAAYEDEGQGQWAAYLRRRSGRAQSRERLCQAGEISVAART